MTHKIKIELDGQIVRCFCWEKTWWIFGKWVPYFNKSFASYYEAYVEYARMCTLVNPFFKS